MNPYMVINIDCRPITEFPSTPLSVEGGAMENSDSMFFKKPRLETHSVKQRDQSKSLSMPEMSYRESLQRYIVESKFQGIQKTTDGSIMTQKRQFVPRNTESISTRCQQQHKKNEVYPNYYGHCDSYSTTNKCQSKPVHMQYLHTCANANWQPEPFISNHHECNNHFIGHCHHCDNSGRKQFGCNEIGKSTNSTKRNHHECNDYVGYWDCDNYAGRKYYCDCCIKSCFKIEEATKHQKMNNKIKQIYYPSRSAMNPNLSMKRDRMSMENNIHPLDLDVHHSRSLKRDTQEQEGRIVKVFAKCKSFPLNEAMEVDMDIP